MGRAKLFHLPGFAWHITHRCHNREFLIKFARDKRRWLYWLFQARKRYKLSILGYCLTSNHIHLLAFEQKNRQAIPRSMLLAASCTARQYNRRKQRSGAFWEDHYHATAVETGDHFRKCLVYIELNMVRAGVVGHPIDWEFCSFREVMGARQKRRLIDLQRLSELFQISDPEKLRTDYRHWIEEAISSGNMKREGIWTENVAVGKKEFVDDIKSKLGLRAIYSQVTEVDEGFVLKDFRNTYHKFASKNGL